MKRFIKIALIVVSVVGALYLIASQFIFIGTSDEDIAYYNFKGNFEKGLDTLSLNWSEQNMDQLHDLYFQLEVVKAMGAIEQADVTTYMTDVNSKAETILKSYFTRTKWVMADMNIIKSLAEYINYQFAINAVDGYHIAYSLLFTTASYVGLRNKLRHPLLTLKSTQLLRGLIVRNSRKASEKSFKMLVAHTLIEHWCRSVTK